MLNLLHSLPRPMLKRLLGAHEPSIAGHLRLETREGGKLRARSEGANIWTLTGREFLAELMSLSKVSPRTLFREDRVAFIGVGTGAQPEVANISSLISPVPYSTGEFLAGLLTPASFPTATSVQYVREFGKTEISLGYNVILTEAGLFTDGDPDNDWELDPPTDFATASGRAPVAYKAFEPITKTTEFTLRSVWEVRIV